MPTLTVVRAPLLQPIRDWLADHDLLGDHPGTGRVFAGNIPRGVSGAAIGVNRVGGGTEWPFDQVSLDHVCRAENGGVAEAMAQAVVAAYETVAYPLDIGGGITLADLETWSIAAMTPLLGQRYRASIVVWTRPTPED